MRQKVTLVLLLVFLFGIPGMILLNLATSEVRGPVTSGSQPGGEIAGRLVDEEEEPLAGREVQLLLVSDTGRREPHETVRAAKDGTFRFDAPAHQGYYMVTAGGGDRVRRVQNVSFLDRRGETIEARYVELVLEQGCLLTVEFLRVDGRPLGSGRYELDGRLGAQGLFGLAKPSLTLNGEIRDGVLELDGLPEMNAVLRARFASGDSVEVLLELTPGEVRRTVEL